MNDSIPTLPPLFPPAEIDGVTARELMANMLRIATLPPRGKSEDVRGNQERHPILFGGDRRDGGREHLGLPTPHHSEQIKCGVIWN